MVLEAVCRVWTFDLDKPIKDYSFEEYNLLLYGSKNKDGKQENPK